MAERQLAAKWPRSRRSSRIVHAVHLHLTDQTLCGVIIGWGDRYERWPARAQEPTCLRCRAVIEKLTREREIISSLGGYRG